MTNINVGNHCNSYHASIFAIPMIQFPLTRTRRRIASAMLVLWLFAVGSAWANACLLQDRATHFDTSVGDRASTAAVSAGHIGIAAGHAGKLSPGEAPCLKVCDEVSQTTVKWQSDVGLNAIPMGPPTARVWAASAAATGTGRHDLSSDTDPASPPLRTLYMRLAL